MEQLALSEKSQLMKIEKEVKFTIGQVGSQRTRELKKVGGGIYSTTNNKGKEMLVAVEIKKEAETGEDITCVIYADAKGKSKCVELALFLCSK